MKFLAASFAVTLAACAPAVSLAASVASSSVPEVLDFDSWAALFHKQYCSEAAEADARAAFDANVRFIQQHNAEADAGARSFRCGVNQFSDLTSEAFRAQHLASPFEVRSEEDRKVAALKLPVGGVAKATIDWRPTAVTPVKDQVRLGVGMHTAVSGEGCAVGRLLSWGSWVVDARRWHCDTVYVPVSAAWRSMCTYSLEPTL
jgi:hypothetical protein